MCLRGSARHKLSGIESNGAIRLSIKQRESEKHTRGCHGYGLFYQDPFYSHKTFVIEICSEKILDLRWFHRFGQTAIVLQPVRATEDLYDKHHIRHSTIESQRSEQKEGRCNRSHCDESIYTLYPLLSWNALQEDMTNLLVVHGYS